MEPDFLTIVETASLNVRRHFLTWDKPLLGQAVDYLAGTWSGDGPLDLSHLLVLVSTRHSARRLREALAGHASQKGSAVFPPLVQLPEALLQARDEPVASPLQSQLAWAETFQSVDLAEFRHVFPIDPPERSLTWALRLAQEFFGLQRTLAEAGVRLCDVARMKGDALPETDRWTEIAQLEQRHDARLQQLGLRPAPESRIDRAKSPVLPPGITRVVLLAVIDPQPLAVSALEVLAQEVPIDVVVFAPPEEATHFDHWGRPVADAWHGRSLDLGHFEERVHLCVDPPDQARRIAAAVGEYGKPEGVVGLGVADAEVLTPLERALTDRQVAVFNPEGRSRQGDQLEQLLAALGRLAHDESFANVESLARCPDFLVFLRENQDAGFSPSGFLSRLDELRASRLPPTLTRARQCVPADPALAAIVALRQELVAGTFPQNAVAALLKIFANRRFDGSVPADAALADASEAWMAVVAEITTASAGFGGLSNADWWDVALRLYAETKYYDEKPAGAVELQGWLELPWEDAPHLIIAGVNEGRVPESVSGDPFLPESLRQRLGLKTNAARFARDAYLLQALSQSRSGEGRLDVFLGKTSMAGDPVRPSRLLFQCPDESLADRVDFLFRPAEQTRAAPAWRRAWKLAPLRVSPPARVAVTGFRQWLECPLRFYFSRVLRMEAVDPAKSEMDVLDFGTLCHAALEAMGHEPALRDCVDGPVLREFLHGKLDLAVNRKYGDELTLPLLVQVETARQRLSRAAEIQAGVRAEGWILTEVEVPFEIEIAGLRVVGKIDRIDRHETSGDWRVVDYKTSDQAVDPAEAHWRGVRRNEEDAREFARFILNGRELVWKDLQLPLYRHAVRARAGAANLHSGYFNLPKATGAGSLRIWDDYTNELDDIAQRCMDGVAKAIREGDFWPPNERVRAETDAFAALFHHGVADSIDWTDAEVSSSATAPAVKAGLLP